MFMMVMMMKWRTYRQVGRQTQTPGNTFSSKRFSGRRHNL